MWPFNRRKPIPGDDFWYLRDAKIDPWGSKTHNPVRILDVKEGWVRYSMGELFPDERMKMSAFLFCYKPWDKA